MGRIIVVKRKGQESPKADIVVGNKRPCGHTKKKDGPDCEAHECCACWTAGFRKLWYPRGAQEIAAAEHAFQTGGITMAKGTKEKKEKRVTAGSILLPQFELARVRDDETLIELVKEATGSKKFDKTQLAWYKSQFRRGLLKGMNGKAGHVINQGSLTKDKKVVKKAKGSDRRKKERRGEEPVED